MGILPLFNRNCCSDYAKMSKAEKLRLVLFGEGGVGKSAITIRYFQVRENLWESDSILSRGLLPNTMTRQSKTVIRSGVRLLPARVYFWKWPTRPDKSRSRRSEITTFKTATALCFATLPRAKSHSIVLTISSNFLLTKNTKLEFYFQRPHSKSEELDQGADNDLRQQNRSQSWSSCNARARFWIRQKGGPRIFRKACQR